MSEEPLQVNQRLLHRLSYGLVAAFTATIGISWALLPEPYTFFRDYISYLGGVKSKHEQLPNLASQISFITGLLLCAAILSLMAYQYLKPHLKKKDKSKAFYLIMAAIGGVMTAFPHDVDSVSPVHYIGAFTFVVSLVIFLIECYFLASKKDRSFGAILEKSTTIILVLITAFYVFIYWYFRLSPEGAILFNLFTQADVPLFQKIMVILVFVGFILMDQDDLAVN